MSEFETATEQLRSKQTEADKAQVQLDDSQQQLRSLQQRLHALHAEVAAAQQAHDNLQMQQADAWTDLIAKSQQLQDAKSQDVSDLGSNEQEQAMGSRTRGRGSANQKIVSIQDARKQAQTRSITDHQQSMSGRELQAEYVPAERVSSPTHSNASADQTALGSAYDIRQVDRYCCVQESAQHVAAACLAYMQLR